MVHPGTAIYVGYNTDLANIYHPLTSNPNDYTELLRSNRYLNDGRQLFVKLSYLLRF
jgi:hypothetical protein